MCWYWQLSRVNIFGRCICSKLKYGECTYVFKNEQELVNKVFILYVFHFGLLNELQGPVQPAD